MEIRFHFSQPGKVFRFLLFAGTCLLGLPHLAVAQGSRGRVVALETLPLVPPVGDIHRITLSGSLDQGGEMVLDGNQFSSADRFGDFQTSTAAFYPPVAVQFRYVDLPDSTGARRKVYEIVGAAQPPKTRYYLVSPSRKSGNYRLIIDQQGQDRRVVSLEVLPEPPTPSERLGRILKVDHALLKTNPPTLVVKVTGQANTAGWSEPKLARRVYVKPPADGIWEFDLFATPPPGNPPPAVSKIEAIYRWTDFDPATVKGLRVYGKDDGVVEVLF